MLFQKAALLEQIEDADRLWSEITKALETAGIRHVIYLTVERDFTRPFVRSTLATLYDDTRPQDDPFLAHCCNSYDITRTGAEFLDEHDYLPPAATAFIRSVVSEGFRSGLGIPMRLAGSQRFGGFNLGTDLTRAAFIRSILPRAEEFRLFCLLMHRRIEELTQAPSQAGAPDFRTPMIAPVLPGLDDLLSPREREITYLLARGRSRKEVAHLCGISVHTVSDYAKAAYRKLGVRNRAEVAQLIFAAETDPPGLQA